MDCSTSNTQHYALCCNAALNCSQIHRITHAHPPSMWPLLWALLQGPVCHQHGWLYLGLPWYVKLLRLFELDAEHHILFAHLM